MNTARILSIAAVAAVAAFASIGAQAAELNGDLYGTDFESRVQSTRNSTEVRAEGHAALPNFAKGPVADHAARAVSTQERTAVRADAVTAARAGLIATGNRS